MGLKKHTAIEPSILNGNGYEGHTSVQVYRLCIDPIVQALDLSTLAKSAPLNV